MPRFNSSMFEHPSPGKADATSKAGSHENLKLSRAELELRKCLGSDTQEPLIKSYACAWQKEILIQGHMYITPRWFCFYSNILGWETKTRIPCDQVTAIEKHRAAMVFPTAVVIATEEKRYGFASFVHRNRAYEVLQNVWQNSLSSEPLSTDDLVRHLNALKKQKHNKDSPPLPRASKPTHLFVNTSGIPNTSSYTTDSSDPEHSYPPSPIIPSAHHLHSTSSDSQETVTTSSLLTAESQLNDSAITTQSGSLATDEDVRDGVAEFPLVHHVPSSETSDSHTGSDSAEDSQLDEHHCRRPKSPSLLALHHDSEQSGGENGEALQGKKEDREMEEEDSAFKWDVLLQPSQWGSGKVFGSVRLWLCSPSNVINLVIVIAIIFLVISTLTMLCKLSHVDPRLQPFLPLQPWCRLCSAPSAHEYESSPIPSYTEDGDYVVLTKALFDEMVSRHHGSSELSETCAEVDKSPPFSHPDV